MTRFAGVVLTMAGAAGVTVCLASASGGFRDVMQTDGGFCASGGPYVIVSQCSAGDARMITAGVMGGLVPLVAGLVGDLRATPAYFGPRPLVRTGVPARRIVIWLVASLAGTGLGLAAISSLIGARK
jgi:hypothetical protein